MKKFISLALCTLMIVSMLTLLSGCGAKSSEGLEFKSNGDGTCTWVGLGTCTDIEIVVPEKNGEETVVSVGEEVLKRKEGIIKVTLPNTIKELEEDALAYNGSLLEIDFGTGLEIIGKNAVGHCEKLSKINLPNGLKEIGNLAFSNDSSLTEVIIPDGVETIGDSAFSFTTSVKKISIPSSLNEFNTFAFCTDSLEEVEIKGNMKYFALNLNTDASGKAAIYGGVCADATKKTSSLSYEGKCTKDNLGAVLCAIFDKQTIKLNGEEVSLTSEILVGKYTKENNMYDFEVTEAQELIISFGAVQKNEIARLKYSVDSKTNTISATGSGNLSGSSISLDATIVPLGDTLFVIMSADDETVIGLWNK